MKYGKYQASLSIGYSGATRSAEWNVSDDFTEQEWIDLGEYGQNQILNEWMDDSIGQYIEMSYWESEE